MIFSECHEQNCDSSNARGEKSEGAGSLLFCGLNNVRVGKRLRDGGGGAGNRDERRGCAILVDSAAHSDVVGDVEVGGVATNRGHLQGDVASEVGVAINLAIIGGGGVGIGGLPFVVLFIFFEIGSLAVPGDVWGDQSGGREEILIITIHGEVVDDHISRSLGHLAANSERIGAISLVNQSDPLVEDFSFSEETVGGINLESPVPPVTGD